MASIGMRDSYFPRVEGISTGVWSDLGVGFFVLLMDKITSALITAWLDIKRRTIDYSSAEGARNQLVSM